MKIFLTIYDSFNLATFGYANLSHFMVPAAQF